MFLQVAGPVQIADKFTAISSNFIFLLVVAFPQHHIYGCTVKCVDNGTWVKWRLPFTAKFLILQM